MSLEKLVLLEDYTNFVQKLAALEDEKEKHEIVRYVARRDLFFLLWFVLKRNDIFNQWLLERCKEIQEAPNGYIDLWAREHYKDIDCAEKVLTANRQWVRHGDLTPNDIVFSPSGKQVKVLAVTEHYLNSECYKITFSDKAQIVCGAGHLWKLRRKIRRRVANSEIRNIEFVEEVKPTWELAASGGRKDIGVSEPLYYPTAFLPLHPYVLGVWLGDGHSSCGRITNEDDEIFDRIESLGYKLSPPKILVRNVYKIMPVLRKIGVLNQKHIPKLYLEASYHQRMELLHGLMDTDGYCNSRGTATFTNINGSLANDVYNLVASLGLRPRFRVHSFKLDSPKSMPNGRYYFYHVSFQAHSDRNPFYLPRKANKTINCLTHRATRTIVKIEKIASIPTNCIHVEGGMYLVGKQLIPTHNSTIITYGKTIQDIIASHGRNPLPEWNGKTPSFCIFSFTRPIAKAFLSQIKREFEQNNLLRNLFPDIFWENPQKEAPKWSEDDGIILRRKSNQKEATIEAWGMVDAQPTSKHYDVRIYDDVVTLSSVGSPLMLDKVQKAFEMSDNLGSQGGVMRMIGTRYHFNDLYKHIIEQNICIPRLHTATLNGESDGEPVLMSRDDLIKKRRNMGIYTFSTQMLLNPVKDSQKGFRREWLRFHTFNDFSGLNIYIIVDPANSKKKTSDYTAMVVVGLSPDTNYYVLDIYRSRLSLTERANLLFMLHRKYRPLGIGYERYGMQADIDYCRDKMNRDKYSFDIIELHDGLNKIDRIEGLVPLFENHRIYLPQTCYKVVDDKEVDITKQVLDEEYDLFPVAQHDDVLDALARITDTELNARFPIDDYINVDDFKDNATSFWGR